MDISKAAQAMGRRGGLVKSKAKTKAVRANGALGGRPRKYPVCTRYENKAHRFARDGHCPCGYRRRTIA